MNWQDYSFQAPILPNHSNPTILAFSCYFHDSSACILKDEKILAAADEERFTRRKHDANFPLKSIQYCLQAAGVNKVDLVVFYENPDIKWQRIQECLKKNPPHKKLRDKIETTWEKIKSKKCIQEAFSRLTGLDNEIIFLDHHLCHAASSYYVSGFDESALVVLDGVGELATSSFGYASGSKCKMLKCINFPDSIGLLYTTLTVLLGFKANDHEYKVMGLAPYGDMNRKSNPLYPKLKEVISMQPNGSFCLDMQYFGHEYFGALPFTDKLVALLGVKPNPREGLLKDEHKNLAAALQLVTEDVVFHVLNYVNEKINSNRLCFAGGVALNSVLNGKILSNTGFKELYIQPSAGDSGTVIGAAKYIQHLCDPKATKEHMAHSSYGPQYNSNEIRSFLDKRKIKYKCYSSDEELINFTGHLLKQKNVIGWFQGRMEWGPRALGNRSILASPLYKDMQDILNEKVKHRELFRPFAPVVCDDDAAKYFDCDDPLPEPTDFMLMVYPIKKEIQKLIPAVTHVDGSGRLQTIRRHQNHLYYDLLKRFGELTKVPILVNTSFNIRGEPIVCTPEDAYRCMMGTEIDYLVIGRFIVSRSDNLKDAWFPTICD